jgi:arylsulfatase A-like enzyme
LTGKSSLFGDWKAVKPRPSAALELYDLANDPGETTTVASNHPDLVAKAAMFMAEAHTDHSDWPLREGAVPKKNKM